MFCNLEKLLISKGITKKSYAEFLGVSEKTIQNKINEVTEFTFTEVEKTNRILFPEYQWGYLFARENNKAS